MRNILHDYLTDIHDFQRIAISIAKGTAARGMRRVDLAQPASWEFSGFSQNGEDGIIEVLLSQLLRPDRKLLEIGAADGVQNNSSWLLVTQQYHGLMVEGSAALSAKAHRLLAGCGIGAEFVNEFVTRDNAAALLERSPSRAPDLFSLDIDGNDYHVARALLDAGLRPKIAILEYNSVFGPERSVTIPYQPAFNFGAAHPTRLYYGVALKAWQKLFVERGYRFVTVDRNGVNAVFADPTQFAAGFLDAVQPLAWAENAYQVRASGCSGEAQYDLIRAMPTVEV
jgi:hypothetical protein